MAKTADGTEVQNVYLEIQGIKIQKDNYEIGGTEYGETEFWKSDHNEAEVLQFKRGKVKGSIACDLWHQEFELIVSLRGGFVRVRVEKNFIVSAEEVYEYLQRLIGAAYRVPGHSWKQALVKLTSQDPARHMLCTTPDSHWFLAALHEIKDEKTYCLPLPVK